jgi:hypothetical protein
MQYSIAVSTGLGGASSIASNHAAGQLVQPATAWGAQPQHVVRYLETTRVLRANPKCHLAVTTQKSVTTLCDPGIQQGFPHRPNAHFLRKLLVFVR